MMTVIGPLLTLALVLAIRVRRPQSERPLSKRFLWLAPTLYLAAVTAMLVRHPPTLVGWFMVLGGVLTGAVIGWVRGRMFALRVDPESGLVLRRRSRAAVVLLVGVVSLRFIANLWVGPGTGVDPETSPTLIVTDFMMGCVFGLLAVTRIEIAIRARRLLAR
ncbi:CcdC protein domain-containing protein [Sphingomonas arenae]|uniref:CcdC protein domain-containing protein n=1 Tax=Sphingomonas arenae TaxID=2812555 RepID=UPI0019675845|nr:CcdC protein domain-containing protein [Sphingomonas arenae]